MKILLISNMYPSKDYPYYGIFVKNTEDLIKEKGIDCKTIVMVKKKGIKKLISYIIYVFKIYYALLSNRYDLLYVHYAAIHSIILLPLMYIISIKIILNVHGSDVVPETYFVKISQIITKRFIKKCNKIVVPSNYYEKLIRETYSKDHESIFVFPSGGVDCEKFSFNPQKNLFFDEFSLDKDRRYIGYVSRIDPLKGWDVFLEAIYLLKKEKLLSDIKIIIVGGGTEIGKMKRLIKEYNLSSDVFLFSMMTQEQLNKIYNCLELFCFPTMRKAESLGLVGLEAMACGVPVIGSKVGGLLDYIVDGCNGFLFDPGNALNLKEKILEYLKLEKSEQNCFRRQAIKTAGRYSSKLVGNELISMVYSI